MESGVWCRNSVSTSFSSNSFVMSHSLPCRVSTDSGFSQNGEKSGQTSKSVRKRTDGFDAVARYGPCMSAYCVMGIMAISVPLPAQCLLSVQDGMDGLLMIDPP